MLSTDLTVWWFENFTPFSLYLVWTWQPLNITQMIVEGFSESYFSSTFAKTLQQQLRGNPFSFKATCLKVTQRNIYWHLLYQKFSKFPKVDISKKGLQLGVSTRLHFVCKVLWVKPVTQRFLLTQLGRDSFAWNKLINLDLLRTIENYESIT